MKDYLARIGTPLTSLKLRRRLVFIFIFIVLPFGFGLALTGCRTSTAKSGGKSPGSSGAATSSPTPLADGSNPENLAQDDEPPVDEGVADDIQVMTTTASGERLPASLSRHKKRIREEGSPDVVYHHTESASDPRAPVLRGTKVPLNPTTSQAPNLGANKFASQNINPAGDTMQVVTIKTKPNLPQHYADLISPPHNSILTPGVVTFMWQTKDSVAEETTFKKLKTSKNKKALKDFQKLLAKKKKPKMFLVVEKLGDSGYITKTYKAPSLRKRVSCTPGQYRWRLLSETKKQDSRWRTFKVVSLKFKGQARGGITLEPSRLISTPPPDRTARVPAAQAPAGQGPAVRTPVIKPGRLTSPAPAPASPRAPTVAPPRPGARAPSSRPLATPVPSKSGVKKKALTR